MLSSALLIAKALENYPVPGMLDNNKAFLLITFLLAQWTDIESRESRKTNIALHPSGNGNALLFKWGTSTQAQLVAVSFGSKWTLTVNDRDWDLLSFL